MRIHQLTMTGIGPYAGTETIDFDTFVDSGRFLLTGPTGSGKTTIIDAIVFALYGEVTDPADSSRERIRSTLVDPQAPSAVELVLSTTAGVYRVRRTPTYERPKKRGQGTTTQNGTVRLWRLGQVGGEPLDEPLTRVGEADAEIRRVVGLSREQLTQTVVLPQGKFARFLRADSTQRQGLLQDVFGTGVYDAIQAQLAQAARSATRQTQEAADRLRAQGRALALEPVLSTAVLQAAQPPQAASPAQAPDTDSSAGSSATPADEPPARPLAEVLEASLAVPVPDLRLLRTVAAAAGEASARAVEETARTAQEALDQLAQARQEHKDAQELHNRLERREALLAEQRALDQRSAQDEQDEARLQAAHRADRTVASLRHTAAAQGRAATAVRSLRHLGTHPLPRGAASQVAPQRYAYLQETLPPEAASQDDPAAVLARLHHEASRQLDALVEAALVSLDDREDREDQKSQKAQETLDSQALDQHARRLRQEHGRLEALVAQEEGLAIRLRELDSRSESLAHDEEKETTRADLLAQRPAQRAQLVRQLETAQAARGSLTALEHQHQQAQERQRATAEAASLSTRLDRQEAELAQRAQAAARAAAQVHSARTRWISSAAGALAEGLSAGEPCPVCGSRDHPAPAVEEGERATREQVEAAQEHQDQADTELVEARRVVEQTRLHLEEALRRAGGGGPQEALTALEEAREALSQARTLAQQEQHHVGQLEEFDAESQRLHAQQEEARTHLERSRTALEVERRQLAEDQERCETARGPWPSVTARAASLLEEATWLEAASQTTRHAAEALDSARQASEELETSLKAEGFASVEELTSALLGRGERERLTRAVRDAHAARQRVRLGLADPQVSSLTGTEEDQLEESEHAEASAQSAYQEAAARHARAQESHTHLERACRSAQEAAAAYEEAAGHHAPLLRVAALARGENPEGVPLATWVLQARFDEVLVFANERLAQMSSGRYELVRVGEETGSRSRRRGLGLAVIDHLGTEHRRDPRTLSGGETFYVSLALALALADVVSAESGGVALDTLFIDEGFGSLDPETLQTVMTEIERLRAGGRTVGIVSHVEELRSQVPDQIQVRRLPSGGSTLRVVP